VRLWTSPALRIVRALLVVLPLLWLAQRLDFPALVRGLEQVGGVRLALGLGLQLCISLVVSVRWRILLSSYRSLRLPSVGFLLRANLVANYLSLLPVPGADEGVRVARTLRAFAPGAPAAWLVLVIERICGLVGLLLLPLLANLGARTTLDATALRALSLGSLVACALAVPALTIPGLLAHRPALRPRVARLPLLGPALAQLEPPKRKLDLVLAVLLSILGHFGSCAVIAILFAPLDAAATLGVCVRVQPIVLLAMAFPLTPGGVGQRELVFAGLYGLAGVASTHAVTVALLSFALALLHSLVGFVVYAVERSSARSTGSAFVDESDG
jgi:uncharacterized membrane protein YbhN (UPF0104 family)